MMACAFAADFFTACSRPAGLLATVGVFVAAAVTARSPKLAHAQAGGSVESRAGPLRRARRSNIENPAAESDVECISPEQVHRIHQQQQECSFPPRLSNEKIRSSKQYHRDDAERDNGCHTINDADEAIPRGRQCERNGDELKREIKANQPR